ncbi:MAG: hypothetical protein IJ282_08440 [Lachnospiraceae bacterium]|nr:hypothetical protein [Lachnospiraceae bacterium]
MENAIWNGKRLLAFEIAKDYYTEKMIRKASYQGELLCPDPQCKSPVLKYCHGEIREPYFAHRDDTQCDYIQYEKSSGVFHGLRLALYEHFQACDYTVQMEVKVLDHHYSHLFFEWEDGNKTALELGTKSTNLKDVEQICAQYKEKDISVSWLVVDQPGKPIKEEHTYFLKRFCLNESANRSLLVLGYDGETITQYKEDPNSYMVDGRKWGGQGYPALFSYKAHLTHLYFEDGALTTMGFQEAYETFLKEKQTAFENYKQQIENDKKQLEDAKEQLQRRYEELQKERENRKNGFLVVNSHGQDYEELKQSILPYINQQEKPVKDAEENRWIRCEFCGEVKQDGEFVSYGGKGRVNLGKCKACESK